jgi:hypothetical protein
MIFGIKLLLIEFGALQCSQYNAQKLTTRQQYSTKYNASAAYTNKSMLSEAPSSLDAERCTTKFDTCNNFDTRNKFDAQ